MPRTGHGQGRRYVANFLISYRLSVQNGAVYHLDGIDQNALAGSLPKGDEPDSCHHLSFDIDPQQSLQRQRRCNLPVMGRQRERGRICQILCLVIFSQRNIESNKEPQQRLSQSLVFALEFTTFASCRKPSIGVKEPFIVACTQSRGHAPEERAIQLSDICLNRAENPVTCG